MEKELSSTILDLISEKKIKEIRDLFKDLHEVEVAEVLNDLPQDANLLLVFRLLDKNVSSEVFANLDGSVQEYIINSITDSEISGIIEELYTDDAVDMIEEMPANVVKRVLKNAKPETRSLINQFLNYPDSSAGSVMTSEFMDLKSDMTVAEAVKRLRANAEMMASIYTCFVTDKTRILKGVVTIKDLLLAENDQTIESIMNTDFEYAHTKDDQEAVAMSFSKYDLISLPVLDDEDRLVGIITIDDIVDVMQEEVTEDIMKMNAMTPTEDPYLKTSAFKIARSRILWLLVLMISSLLSGFILEGFEASIASIPILVVFIPMLMDTGGNAGSQAATTIIRGLAINEITPKDVLRVVWKEIRVALMCGIVLCIFNAIRVSIQYPDIPGGVWKLILVLTISMMCTITCAKLLGAVLPIVAKKLKLDPAIMATPLITTIVDATSLLIFFSLVSAFYSAYL